jgi:predicted MFS family arabinose efflux permease
MFVFLGLYPTWLLNQTFGPETGHSVSLIFLAGGLGGLSGALLTGVMGIRISSSQRACSVLSALTAASLVSIPFMGAILAGQIICYGLASTFRAIFLPILISKSMSVAEPSQRGSTNGILAAVFQSGTAIGAAVSAWLYSMDTSYIANVSVALALFVAASYIFSNTKSADIRST